jgi:uncharacterized membrane protein affecting hemolysin expression
MFLFSKKVNWSTKLFFHFFVLSLMNACFTQKDKQTAFSALEFCSKVAEGPVSNDGSEISAVLRQILQQDFLIDANIYTGFQQQTLDSEAGHSVNVRQENGVAIHLPTRSDIYT